MIVPEVPHGVTLPANRGTARSNTEPNFRHPIRRYGAPARGRLWNSVVPYQDWSGTHTRRLERGSGQ
jgi:hypothetical protein